MEISEKVVYLDNAATTACAPEALAVMVEALSGACGNPSSHYSIGYEAKEFVDTGRAQVAKAINAAPAEIFFTGCGSEADNWAVKGTAFTKARQNKKHLITSAFEHHAIMHSMAALERMGFEVTYIKPTPEGYIRPEDVEAAIRPDTALVSIMMANNEIGTIQPIKEIAEVAHKHGVWMHTDAVQAVGAIPVDVKDLGVDMLSMSAHKFNGPKGMGALYCRKGVWPQNLIDGGSQEARHRAGTENVAGIAAMGKALEIATTHLDERMAHETELRDYVIDRVLKNIPEARLNGGVEHRPHQKDFHRQHQRVFDGAGGQVVEIALAVEHGLPHAAQQHVAAVIDNKPHHNNAQQRWFALVQQHAVDEARQHRRDEVTGEIRLAVAGEQKPYRVDDGTGHHAHAGAVAHAAQTDHQKAEVNFKAWPQQVDGQTLQHDGHGADQARKSQHADVAELRPGGAPVGW